MAIKKLAIASFAYARACLLLFIAIGRNRLDAAIGIVRERRHLH